jgi:predicted Holliday junction resolvase-like endonuclease
VEWIDSDTKRHLHYTNVWGKKRIIELDYNEEVKELSKKQVSRGASQEVKNISKRLVYQASLIIDTDIVYDNGLAPNQSRWSKKEPMLSFFAVRGIKTNDEVVFGSITEAIIPFYDGFVLAWKRFQNSLSNVIDQGYAINLRLLANMKMGGKDLSEDEAIKMFKRSGLLPYMDMAPGIQYRGGDVLPIHEIQGGLGTRLLETVQLMEFNLNMISEITGISPVILGQTPEKDLPVRTMQQQLQGTNNSIRPIINNIFTLKEELASASSIRIQTAVKYDKEAFDNYCKVVGRQDMGKIKEGIGLGVDYGIRMDTRPSQEEKQRILEAAQAALQRGRDGEAQIDLDVYLYIEEQIMGDCNLKEMRQKLRFVIRKEKELAQAAKDRNIQLQGQINAQVQQQKDEAMLKSKQMDVQLKQQENQQQIAVERMNKNYDANIKWFETLEQYLNDDGQNRVA